MSERSIWKFPLEVTDRQMVAMPLKSEILSVGVQRGVICLWANVDPQAASSDREFAIIGTGHPVTTDGLRFIGTAIAEPFVCHVFERTR